jgi:hypothetical protein
LAGISAAPKLLTIRHSRTQTAELKVNFLIYMASVTEMQIAKSQSGDWLFAFTLKSLVPPVHRREQQQNRQNLQPSQHHAKANQPLGAIG